MDKSIEKGQIRNRYAKLQPLANRITRFQSPNFASNYYRNKPYDDRSINSYAHQLQNNFGNLVLANDNNMDIKVVKKPVDVELRNSEIPLVSSGQSVLSPVTNAEIAKKQKKHKHRNKEKIYRTSFLDLKAELVDILNCILYILWSPIVFFLKLSLSFASFSASLLWNILNLFVPRCTNTNPEKNALKLEEKRLEILNSFTANSQKEKMHLINSNKSVSKRSSNFTHSVTNTQAQTDGGKCRRDLQSLKKKFNLSLEMVDEMCGNLGINGGNYLQYSSRHQDISSIELSSECLSDKYSSRFFDHKDGRKKALRQYQKSVSIAGKKTSLSTLKNPSFKSSKTIFNSKQSRVHLKNSSCKNEMYDKYTNSKLESIECGSSRTGTEDRFSGYQKRKKRSEMSRSHIPFAPLPLGLTLQKKSSSEDEHRSKDVAEKCDSNLINDSKISLARNHELQPSVDPHLQITTKLETYVNIEKDVLQENDRCNAKKLICQRDAACSTFPYKLHSRTIQNEAIVSRNLKTVADFDKSLPRNECVEHTKTIESLSVERVNQDLPQCEKLSQDFEGEKRKNNDKSKAAEFTKPIDAKSKWIEMKKKFYGKDYAVMQVEPEKLEAASVSSVKSISKLPAQNIFRYNMQVGRARQMGEEPPLAANISLERKTTAPCLESLGNSAADLNPRRREQQCSKTLVPKSRCLSQTQSLSQWPLHFSGTKTYCSPQQEPKPKPKPRIRGELNQCKVQGDGKTSATSFAQISQRAATRTNSSASSSDVRHNRVFPLDWLSQAKNLPIKNPNSVDNYADNIDSLIAFCQSTPSALRKSNDREFIQVDRADCKFFDDAAAGDSS